MDNRSGGNLTGDNWHAQIYMVNRAAYTSIDLQNMIYPYWVVSFIRHGHVQVSDGPIIQHAVSDQVMVHAPSLPFGEKADTPGVHYWLLLDIRNQYNVELFRIFPMNEVITLSDPAVFFEIIQSLLKVWDEYDGPFRELELCGLGLRLAHHLLESWDRSGRPVRKHRADKQNERLDTVMSYLHAHLQMKITRRTLADLIHLNPNYLDKIFADKFRLKPMQMLRELRLREAARMLEASELNLSDIAAQCGLGDAPYLSRQFVRHYGMTPGAFRDKSRQSNRSYYRPTDEHGAFDD